MPFLVYLFKWTRERGEIINNDDMTFIFFNHII